MPSCPPLFTNFKNTFETNIGGCFDGFWYYPNNLVTNRFTRLVVPSNVAYDYNRNCVTVNGLPVAPDCYGVFSAVPEFVASNDSHNKYQTGYAPDVPNMGNVFFDPSACNTVIRRMYLQSSDGNEWQIKDSLGRSLWINAAVRDL